jgi:hypothetical protein
MVQRAHRSDLPGIGAPVVETQFVGGLRKVTVRRHKNRAGLRPLKYFQWLRNFPALSVEYV